MDRTVLIEELHGYLLEEYERNIIDLQKIQSNLKKLHPDATYFVYIPDIMKAQIFGWLKRKEITIDMLFAGNREGYLDAFIREYLSDINMRILKSAIIAEYKANKSITATDLLALVNKWFDNKNFAELNGRIDEKYFNFPDDDTAKNEFITKILDHVKTKNAQFIFDLLENLRTEIKAFFDRYVEVQRIRYSDKSRTVGDLEIFQSVSNFFEITLNNIEEANDIKLFSSDSDKDEFIKRVIRNLLLNEKSNNDSLAVNAGFKKPLESDHYELRNDISDVAKAAEMYIPIQQLYQETKNGTRFTHPFPVFLGPTALAASNTNKVGLKKIYTSENPAIFGMLSRSFTNEAAVIFHMLLNNPTSCFFDEITAKSVFIKDRQIKPLQLEYQLEEDLLKKPLERKISIELNNDNLSYVSSDERVMPTPIIPSGEDISSYVLYNNSFISNNYLRDSLVKFFTSVNHHIFIGFIQSEPIMLKRLLKKLTSVDGHMGCFIINSQSKQVIQFEPKGAFVNLSLWKKLKLKGKLLEILADTSRRSVASSVTSLEDIRKTLAEYEFIDTSELSLTPKTPQYFDIYCQTYALYAAFFYCLNIGKIPDGKIDTTFFTSMSQEKAIIFQNFFADFLALRIKLNKRYPDSFPNVQSTVSSPILSNLLSLSSFEFPKFSYEFIKRKIAELTPQKEQLEKEIAHITFILAKRESEISELIKISEKDYNRMIELEQELAAYVDRRNNTNSNNTKTLTVKAKTVAWENQKKIYDDNQDKIKIIVSGASDGSITSDEYLYTSLADIYTTTQLEEFLVKKYKLYDALMSVYLLYAYKPTFVSRPTGISTQVFGGARKTTKKTRKIKNKKNKIVNMNKATKMKK